MVTLEDIIKLRLKQDKSNKGYVKLISDFRNEKCLPAGKEINKTHKKGSDRNPTR